MSAKTLMIQGTGSSVGKSLLVAALCRIFKLRGIRVAPFKSQNMALNSFITPEGHEMGRAQVVQAEAAGLTPNALMNPILLKPTTDQKSQVIVNGKVYGNMSAQEYYDFRHNLIDDIMAAFQELSSNYDLVIIEGAGSPAEINLKKNDLVNMGLADMVDAPVVLVGDIDRGGVFAALYGTIKLLPETDQARVKAFLINKFRGDLNILTPGIEQLESILKRPSLGVLPYTAVRIDEEDSLTDRLRRPSAGEGDQLEVAVIRLPRLSNFTDFAAFDIQPGVNLRYVGPDDKLGHPDMLIIPGSKNTIEDLRYLKRSGLADQILRLHREDALIVGICGGFQMLGHIVKDPGGQESSLPEMPGLGLLNMETIFEPEKHTTQAAIKIENAPGHLKGTEGLRLTGYEIHLGRSFIGPNQLPLATNAGTAEGAVNPEGTVFGTYLHGIFDNLFFTRTILNNLRRKRGLPLEDDSGPASYDSFKDAEYNRLAKMVESNLDMKLLNSIIGLH